MPKTMRFLFRFIVFFYLWGLFTAQRQKKEESTEEVKIEVLHRPENCSKTSKKGDLLNAHYDGYLAKDGSKFYCSRTQNEGHPKWFVLGVGQVIKGLDIAMTDMCPGEKRKVVIPPSFAYGKEGYEYIWKNMQSSDDIKCSWEGGLRVKDEKISFHSNIWYHLKVL
ncbi:peptidyl-prolyl cis-trans isomerase FKBP7 isoform X3 [Symphalangus syndactylus]|uniref:peptidyl-prolyl cis-trans isomerase FKBP7 isoform X3 n=1 Tax=Symphalangus syndactylus TaxID=9590 RepID=UPI003005C5DB